jgi:hypothetical protein
MARRTPRSSAQNTGQLRGDFAGVARSCSSQGQNPWIAVRIDGKGGIRNAPYHPAPLHELVSYKRYTTMRVKKYICEISRG